MASRTPVGVIGVGLMGEVYARRLVAAGFTVIGFDVDPAKNARLGKFRRAGRNACRYRAKMRADRGRGVQHRAGRGCGRARAHPGRRRQDRARHLDLRSRPHRRARRARRRQIAFSRDAGVRHERTGPPGRRRRLDRRRPKNRGRRRAGARRAVRQEFSHRQDRRRRPRQARGQSHPRPQPPGAGRRAGLCRRASGSIRRRSSTSPAARPRPRRSWTPRDRK